MKPDLTGSLAMREASWRQRPSIGSQADSVGATLSKWSLAKPQRPVEFTHELAGGEHTITINKTVSAGRFTYGTKEISLSNVAANSCLLVPPGQETHIVFTDAAEAYRLYLSQALLAECHRDLFDTPAHGDIVLSNVAFLRDRPVQHMIQAMLEISEQVHSVSQMIIESISLAIASRSITLDSRLSIPKPRVGPLAKWRLQRVTEYIDAHLFDQIYLNDLSSVAGLTRMHFSAQFRLATGATPNAYVLKMKIRRAQQLIQETDLSLLDISIMLGFKSQSHFTLVFKKVVGDTPARWRTVLK